MRPEYKRELFWFYKISKAMKWGKQSNIHSSDKLLIMHFSVTKVLQRKKTRHGYSSQGGLYQDGIKLNTCISCMHTWLCLTLTPWIVARQAPLSMEFSRQEYWSRLPFPTPGSLPDPGVKSTFLASPALAGHSFPLHHLGSS